MADVLEATLAPPGFIAPGNSCKLAVVLTPKVRARQEAGPGGAGWGHVQWGWAGHRSSPNRASSERLGRCPLVTVLLPPKPPCARRQEERDAACELRLLTPSGTLRLPVRAAARRALPAVGLEGETFDVGGRGGGVMVAARAGRTVAITNSGALDVEYAFRVCLGARVLDSSCVVFSGSFVPGAP
jgi:hypothetical protein